MAPTINEFDPIARPQTVSEEYWNSLTPGKRVRILRSNENRVFFGVETYNELRKLPFWAFYGPEHGFPEDWFNPRGFLLPRYRPGGPDFWRLRRWRRAYRISFLLYDRLRARYLQMADEAYPFVVGVLILAYFGSGFAISNWATARYGDFWGSGLQLPILAVGVGLFVLVLRLARRFILPRVVSAVVRCALSKAAKAKAASRIVAAHGSHR